MAKKVVASGNGSIAKATKMNPHAQGWEGVLYECKTKMGGQHLKSQTGNGQELKISKLD